MPHPLAARFIVVADGISQRTVRATRMAELGSQLRQQIFGTEVTASLGNLMPQLLGQCEVLEQRDDVGKGLVKGEHIRVGRL